MEDQVPEDCNVVCLQMMFQSWTLTFDTSVSSQESYQMLLISGLESPGPSPPVSPECTIPSMCISVLNQLCPHAFSFSAQRPL